MSGGQWFLLILAFVAAAFVVRFLLRRSRLGAEMAIMTATETSRVADVGNKAVGALIELNGTLRSEAPLTSEFAKLPCIFYRALSEVETERPGRHARYEYKTLSDVIRFAPCVLEDASGKVAVDLGSATIEGTQVHRRRESDGLNLASLAGTALNIGGRIVAHRFTEWIIAPDAQIFVLGTTLAGGNVGKSLGSARPFVVSVNSKEERTRSLARTRLWLLVGTVVATLAVFALLATAFGPFAPR